MIKIIDHWEVDIEAHIKINNFICSWYQYSMFIVLMTYMWTLYIFKYCTYKLTATKSHEEKLKDTN